MWFSYMQLEKKYEELISQIGELKSQLNEAQDTIDAIRSGEVDAFIVKNGNGHELYTLKSADQTYRIFIEKMMEGAVTVSKDGTILYSNTSFAEMVNLPLAKVLGFSFESFIPDESKPVIHYLIEKAWKEECKAEIGLPGKNGKLLPVLLSMNTLEIDGGLALSIIVTDLSFQKETQEQLRQKNYELEQAHLVTKDLNDQLEKTVRERTNELYKSREHFNFLADNIPAIVWTAMPNGKVDYFNKRWFEFTGSSNELLSNEFWLFIHPDDMQNYFSSWEKAVASNSRFENVHRIKNNSNEYKWHFTQASPFNDPNNETVAWFGISTDIDEQKRALEKKDEFISIASHELKTPVTSIKGYVQLLRFNFQQEGNKTAADLLTKADIQINKLTNLISDLLDVRKIENGQLRYHEEKFDFNDLVKEIIEETERVTRHTIECELAPTCAISGDRNKIGQVITNFIDNAGKYSPTDAVIKIKTTNTKNRIRLAVQDFGLGIPKDQQAKVFERFFRVNGEKENTYAGLGLGLYISSEIIKRHSGTIGVESEQGKGSIFNFELPIL